MVKGVFREARLPERSRLRTPGVTSTGSQGVIPVCLRQWRRRGAPRKTLAILHASTDHPMQVFNASRKRLDSRRRSRATRFLENGRTDKLDAVRPGA